MCREILILALLVTSFLQGQTKFEIEMEKAMNEWNAAKSTDDLEKVAQHFDRIAKVENQNWLPLYYSMLIRTLVSFSMEPDKAIKQVNKIEDQFDQLYDLNEGAEVLILRGLFRTVKVAKDPQTYGMVLSSAIIKDYDDALKKEPKNPRANYLMAQFNMGGAEFWGKDPKEFCPQVQNAKNYFALQNVEGFYPKWGEKQVDEILETTCKP